MDAVEFQCDIAIAGGGPAGALAAIFLARAGFRVGLANLPVTTPRYEGLAARVCAVLAAQGIAPEGIGAARQRQVCWGDVQAAQNVEHIVARHRFDHSLLAQAKAEGCVVLEGTIATVSPRQGRIRLQDGRCLVAALLFEARGRRAARRKAVTGNDLWRGPDNLSIAGCVAPQGLSGSAITAGPEGWVWQARLRDGREWLQIMTDARQLSGRETKATLQDLWQKHLAPMGIKAAMPSDPVVRAAGARLNRPDFDPACPALGDAAVAFDPLSGHGLFWAVSSALMAEPMARAILAGQADLAGAFYRQRVIETFWRQARVGRDFYAMGGFDGDFWRARQQWPDQKPSHASEGTPRLARRVICRNGALEQAQVLITEAEPGGVAFVLGLELAPILHAIGDRPLPPLTEFQTRILSHVPPALAARLHDWLTTRGLANTSVTPLKVPEEEISTCDTRPAA